ncbi:two-component system response regulator BtsR [Spirosoma daeguense]
MRTILIDDERLALDRLTSLLSSHQADIDIIGTALNGHDGLLQIRQLRPDVIFLDIEMPLLSGFEMLARLDEMPMVVFTTAYDHYAIRAFEQNSVDYLLKPIEIDRLNVTIQRLRRRKQAKAPALTADDLTMLLQQTKPAPAVQSISVKSGDRILLVPLNDISYFEAQERYVFLSTSEGSQFITNYTINILEEKLPEHFIRISRSYIVNTTYIKEIYKYFGGKYLVALTDRKASRLLTGTAFTGNLKRVMEL